MLILLVFFVIDYIIFIFVSDVIIWICFLLVLIWEEIDIIREVDISVFK